MKSCRPYPTFRLMTVRSRRRSLSTPWSRTATLAHQCGVSAVEFIIAAVPILLLGLGAMETGRWHIQKQQIRYALLEAQRAGTVHHNHPADIIRAFEQAITPLFVPAGQYGSPQARRDAYFEQVQQRVGLAPWRMVIHSPTEAHFRDFKQEDLAIARSTGHHAINNNYQQEQHQAKPRGLHSQDTIYNANVLEIRLIYPYRPMVPGVSALMRVLGQQTDDPMKQAYFAGGYLPLQVSAQLGMQSHPVQWPTEPSDKVIWASQASSAASYTPIPGHSGTLPPGALPDTETCSGLWCSDSSHERAGREQSHPQPPHNSGSYDPHGSGSSGGTDKGNGKSTGQTTGSTTGSASQTTPLPPNSTLSPNDLNNHLNPPSSQAPEVLDDPLCDITLCC